MCLTRIVPTSERAVVKGYKVFISTEEGLAFDTFSSGDGKYLHPGTVYKDKKTKVIRTTAIGHDDSRYSGWEDQHYLIGYHFFLKKDEAIWYANNRVKCALGFMDTVYDVWECSFQNITAVGVQEVRPYWVPGGMFPASRELAAATARTMKIQRFVHKGTADAFLEPTVKAV